MIRFITKSIEYLEPEDKDGICLLENIMIDGEDYTFIHRETETEKTIEISGAENEVISFNKISEELKTKKHINLLNSGWTYFGPETFRVSWKKGASIAVIAGAIAIVAGGPVGMFFGAAGTLIGVSIGCTVIKSGKYKIEGTHVEGHYKSEYMILKEAQEQRHRRLWNRTDAMVVIADLSSAPIMRIISVKKLPTKESSVSSRDIAIQKESQPI